ncbi:dihydrolipoyl dehydrogenase family protein [Liquorilactobacillus mali]|uniref:dihydrolipoyl dehydrogenase family protein n=1 Tax=Liquorilactobacillus mali TaxID=1618 RepID=UPI0029552B71|nr:NAD(P)/FAD-dependent oxidoreductase [Liquorilactobacillus mali]MDV7757245.1 NAD(P)/FAD-dependent oxidoreductase [Liquorilactobacillus mali]
MEKFDVIFIGSGHANWHAAVDLQKKGKKVAIVEKDLIAGTCTNYGCNAKILLDGAADLIHQSQAYTSMGLKGDLHIDWPELMAYKQATINPIHLMLEQQFKAVGIEIFNGTASFLDQHSIKVGEKILSATNFIIGTGQTPNRLPVDGNEFLHDSREFLDLSELPNRMTFIGAGIVSLEFAMLVRAAGTEVSIIEFAPGALRGFNQKYVGKLLQQMEEMGIKIYFNEAVQEIQKRDNQLIVSTASGLEVRTDYVLDATGRIPNINGLNLDAAGVKYKKGGIVVDDHLRTSVPHIYASGDVIDKQIPRLTPTATFESNYLASLLLGENTESIIYPVIASVVFTLPRIAQVGLSEMDIENKKDKYLIKEIPYGKRLRFQTKNEPDAEATLIFNRDSYLVGASVYGDEAPELINILAMIIGLRLTQDDLNKAILAFPSQTIGLISMMAPYLRKSK